MARQKTDWTLHGSRIIELYESGLSSRDVVEAIQKEFGVEYKSGTIRHYIGKMSKPRTKPEAHDLAILKSLRICETCEKEFVPSNWNHRWCDECTGGKQYAKRVRAHGLPAIIFERVFEEQQKKCAICGKCFQSMISDSPRRTLCIDHDHETNQFRGLLCVRCNGGLCFVDDEKWLHSAQHYLENAKKTKNPIFVKPPRVRYYRRRKPISIEQRNVDCQCL